MKFRVIVGRLILPFEMTADMVLATAGLLSIGILLVLHQNARRSAVDFSGLEGAGLQ